MVSNFNMWNTNKILFVFRFQNIKTNIMINKVLVLLIILTVTPILLLSQNTFAKAYDMYNWGNEIALNINQVEDNYIIMGNGFKVKDSILYNGYNFFKIDKWGNLLWKKINFTDYNFSDPNSFYREGNELYYVLQNEKDYYNAFLSIYHTNENGDTLDFIRINDIDSVKIGNEGITKIGNYFYLLNAKKSREEDVRWHSRQKVHLIKVDKKGNVVKRKKFDAPNRLHVPWNLYKTHDNNLIFTRVYTDTGDVSKKIAMLCKYDTSFNEIWSTEIGYSRHENSPPFIANLSDGGYVTSFTLDSFGYWDYIAKYDDTGKRLWKRNLIAYIGKYLGDGCVTHRKIYGFNTAKNGDILVYGWTEALRLYGDCDLNNARFMPWIARLDTDGNILWMRYLMENIDNQYFTAILLDIIENKESNIMLVGGYIPYKVEGPVQLANNEFSFVIQLDSEGCFTPGCDSLTFIGVEYVTGVKDIMKQSIKKLNIYPNPTSEYITIDTGTQDTKYKWQFIDILGYIVKTGECSSLQRIDVSTLSSGIYFIRVIEKGNIIGIGRFVVE